MLNDILFDRLVRQRRLSEPQYSNEPNTDTETSTRKPNSGRLRSGNRVDHFLMNQPTFVGNIENRARNIQNFAAGKTVFNQIGPFANLDATMDSSARFPPPSCHPGTRLEIRGRLFNWLMNHKRMWSMIWLNGPAGTGKSAVAQTFAERCAENHRLGASFFFSRPNGDSDPDTVIPSLTYQLAAHLPHYKSLVTVQLANDPELLQKTRRTQFEKLIVEPLSQLQADELKRIREPLLIVLDGLDECKGEYAQREIIEMINEVIQSKHDFPLIWLICSRPEVHLKYLFSRADFTVSCGREELAIDAESIADVDFYLWDGLASIKDIFADAVTPTPWPSEEQFKYLSRKASGHFAFASTILRYIGDVTYANPMARLDESLSFLADAHVGVSNPLERLDALYTHIVRSVPNEAIPAIKQILGFYIWCPRHHEPSLAVCNLFHIDQATFYRAFRNLQSAIDVPSPEAASDRPLRFYPPSFMDYLRDPSRSGRFVIVEEDFWLDFAKSCLSWYKTDLTLFHTTDGSTFNESHIHRVLPDLTWVSDDMRTRISHLVVDLVEEWCWTACNLSGEWDKTLLSQIQDLNFRYIRKDNLDAAWCDFVHKLWKTDCESGVIRTEPRSEVDVQLLMDMKSMVEPVLRCRPAIFPLYLDGGEYFLLGFDSKAIVCWTTGCREKFRFGALSPHKAPSAAQINAYRAWLVGEEDSDSAKGPSLILTALKLLKARSLSESESFSPGYCPPLGCHPKTRKTLRAKIAGWLNDTQRDWTVLWLTGPAGVGKTIVAQTVAQDCRRIGRLGAVVSASKFDKIGEIIFTLVYQLALQYPNYRQLIAQELAANPTILDKKAIDIFGILFTEPLLHLNIQDPNFLCNPLLFILDMEDDVSDYLDPLFSHITTSALQRQFHFLWVVCSRYEGFLEEEITQRSKRLKWEELTFDDTDAQQDVRHVFHDGFGSINRLFSDLFPSDAEPWPSQGQLDVVSSTASGFFPFALSVLDFVANPEFRDPLTRLNTCIDLIQNPGNVGEIHPLRPLFLFCKDVLGSLPWHSRLLVHFYLRCFDSNFMAQDLANLLNLTQRNFYLNARRLRPIFHVPGPSEASSQALRPYHSSFHHLLQQLYPGESESDEFIATLITWHSICLGHRCESEECETWPMPAWQYRSPDDLFSFVTKVKELVWQVDIWAKCAATLSTIEAISVVGKLRQYKFCHLKQIDVRPGHTFCKFLAWLLNLGSSNRGLIRYKPSSVTDNLLAKKYGRPWLKLPLDHTGDYYVISLHHTEPVPPPIELISTHAKERQYVKRVDKGMCWLGIGERACLIIAYEESFTVLSGSIQSEEVEVSNSLTGDRKHI